MQASPNVALAVDLGGTRVRVALVDRQSNLLARRHRATRATAGREQVLRYVAQAIRSLLKDSSLAGQRSGVLGIGMGLAGPVDPLTGTMINPPNLPGWDHFSPKAWLEERFQMPVWVGNDANLACLGEHRHGAGQGKNHLVYLTVSTGIGGGVIIDGELLLGAYGFAAELGHMSIDRNGPRCNCGNVGCLEALASGTAIATSARRRILAGETSTILDLAGGKPTAITAEEVGRAAAQGDRLAGEVLQQAATDLGLGLVNLLHIFDPELIILGGGVARTFHLLFPTISRTMRRYAMAQHKGGVPVVASALGDDAGLLGAATLAFQRHDEKATART